MLKSSRKLLAALSLSVLAVPAWADAPADTAVAAKVTIDGKPIDITFGDVKKRLKSLPKEIQGEKIEKIYEPLLQTTIDMLILSNNAKKKGLDKNPDVQQRIKDCEEATVQKAYLDGEIEGLQSDAQLRIAYDEAIKILPNVDEVSFSHAAFRDKAKAEKFLAQLKANKGDFKKTLDEAQKADPEVKGVVDVDFTKLPELPPALAEAMKNAKGATILPKVIEEKLGNESIFFVAYVKDRRPAKKPTFEQAKPELKSITLPKFAQEVIERDRKGVKIEKFGMDGKPMADKPAASPAAAPVAPAADAPAPAAPAAAPAN